MKYLICGQMLQKIEENAEFSEICFSDEAVFTLHGTVVTVNIIFF